MLIISAFVLGIGGSLHCAAMCGPLIFTSHRNLGLKGLDFGVLLYHLGRKLGYGVLVSLFSLIRIPAVLFKTQQYLSIVAGILLLLLVFKNQIPFVKAGLDRISRFLSSKMSSTLNNKPSIIVLGLLNGLLPCGLSYAAAALALGQSSLMLSYTFILFFGLGTLPLFLVGSVLQGRIPHFKLKKINQYLNYALGVMAVLLIIRGSGLGIPYLSPTMNSNNSGTSSQVDCCGK